MSAVLAFIGNIDIVEVLLIGGVALLVFGKDLPRVLIRGLAHLTRLRRQLNDLWRQAGIEEELRKMRREVEQDMPSPKALWREELDRTRAAASQIRESIDPRPALEAAARDVEEAAARGEGPVPIAGEDVLGPDFGALEIEPNDGIPEGDLDPNSHYAQTDGAQMDGPDGEWDEPDALEDRREPTGDQGSDSIGDTPST